MTSRPSYAAMAQHASFEHEKLKLSDKSIRLFQVQRSKDHEPISLRITQFSAYGRPKYKAISYTWGDAHNRNQILVNGQAFNLHKNLWELLYHLRLSQETSFFWADALCINQSNLRERNFHVQFMGRIYQKAESVIVWLGLGSQDQTERRAIEFVKEISAFRKAHPDAVSITTYLKPEMQHRWDTLYRMTEHYYWHRTWIIQEFLFASDIEVFSGKHKLQWKLFEDLVDLLRCDPTLTSNPLISRILQSRTTRLTLRRKATSLTTLHELLKEYSDSTCTEPRDKVYGILGLAADCAEDPDTGEALGVKPDYEKHIVEVFLDALECVKLSLSSGVALPAAMLLILQALHIKPNDISKYVSRIAAASTAPDLTKRSLVVTPQYVSPILAVFNWTGVRDLQQQLEAYDWGEHIGYEVQRVPSNTPRLTPGGRHRLRRLSSRTIHSTLPLDFIPNILEAANLCTDLALLHNYPSHHELSIPTEHIGLHTEDKRLFDNSELTKPPVVLEQDSDSETLRLGFACTNVQRNDTIIQFRGLETALIVREFHHRYTFVGKAMMVKNASIKYEEAIDPICDSIIWTSHCWRKRNVEGLYFETDALSMAELLMKS